MPRWHFIASNGLELRVFSGSVRSVLDGATESEGAHAHRTALPLAFGMPTPLSVLDLSPIIDGSDASQTFRNTLDLARHAERLGWEPSFVGLATDTEH